MPGSTGPTSAKIAKSTSLKIQLSDSTSYELCDLG